MVHYVSIVSSTSTYNVIKQCGLFWQLVSTLDYISIMFLILNLDYWEYDYKVYSYDPCLPAKGKRSIF